MSSVKSETGYATQSELPGIQNDPHLSLRPYQGGEEIRVCPAMEVLASKNHLSINV